LSSAGWVYLHAKAPLPADGPAPAAVEWELPAAFAARLDQFPRRDHLADEKLYKAENMGCGTFIISKPKRKNTKTRQSKLKNPQRGARR
ncbi:MAG: hypothetical protein AAB654_15275, partial [Acidobacteriota bacterium]